MPTIGRVLAAAGLLLLGAVAGVAATAVHALWWGLLLGVAATVATAVAARPGMTRIAFSAGWVAVVGVLSVPRGEGDYVIGQDLPGYVLLATALALVVTSVATLPARRRVRGTEGAGS